MFLLYLLLNILLIDNGHSQGQGKGEILWLRDSLRELTWTDMIDMRSSTLYCMAQCLKLVNKTGSSNKKNCGPTKAENWLFATEILIKPDPPGISSTKPQTSGSGGDKGGDQKPGDGGDIFDDGFGDMGGMGGGGGDGFDGGDF